MTKKGIVIIADYADNEPMSFDELCVNLGISADFMRDLMAYEIIEARERLEERLFDMAELKRIRAARRLQRDLEVNFAGVAIILDLLEQMEDLRQKAALFERHV